MKKSFFWNFLIRCCSCIAVKFKLPKKVGHNIVKQEKLQKWLKTEYPDWVQTHDFWYSLISRLDASQLCFLQEKEKVIAAFYFVNSIIQFKLNKDLLLSLDSLYCAILIMLDLTSAFDTTDYSILYIYLILWRESSCIQSGSQYFTSHNISTLAFSQVYNRF